jgi:hypothetical protein
MLAFADITSDEQAQSAAVALARYFKSCRIPFAVSEHPDFVAFITCLRSSFVKHPQIPSREQLAGTMLDAF